MTLTRNYLRCTREGRVIHLKGIEAYVQLKWGNHQIFCSGQTYKGARGKLVCPPVELGQSNHRKAVEKEHKAVET